MKYNTNVNEVFTFLEFYNGILKIYDEIEKMEIANGGWAFHNFEHVKNVMNNATKILFDLNYENDIIVSCKIACLLHDVGALNGKDGHAERSYEFAKKYFEEHGWLFENSDDILDAIKNHSSGFDSKNIITLAIILADKLDVKKNRISEEGKKIKGNRQYSHIEDVIVSINDNKLTINFITDGNIDLKEVNEYYFTSKIFNAIKSFAHNLDLEYSILLDNNIWIL